MTNEKTMKSASVWKLILTMGLPCVLVTLMTVVYNMADIFFMGRTGATMQVAAIGLAGPAFAVLQALGVLLGMGGCTAISAALGAGERDKVKKYSAFCFWGSIAVGVVIMIAGLLFMNPLVSLLGADAATAEYTATYLRILAIGAPFTVFSNTFGNLIRSDGSTVQAMIGMMLGLVLNVLLDPLFILVFKWGIAGAAVATVLGNVASVVFCVIVMGRKDCFSFSIKDLSLKKDVAGRVLLLGLPTTVSTLMSSFAGVFGNNVLMGYGATAIAAAGVSSKAGMIICMLVIGVCMGVQPAMSYAFGMGDRKRMRSIVRGLGIVTTAIASVLALGMFFIRDGFISAFLSDPEVLSIGRTMLTASLLTAPLCGIDQLTTAYLQSTEKASWATLTAVLRQFLVFLPVMYTLNALFGFMGFVAAGPVVGVISTAISVTMCLVWARKLTRRPAIRETAEAEEKLAA